MPKVQDINFSALDQIQKDTLTVKDWAIISLMLVVPLVLSIFDARFMLLILPGLIGFFVYGFAAQNNLRRHNEVATQIFAMDNGFNYTPTFSDDFKTEPGTLFVHGQSKKAAHIITGEFVGFPFTLFRYEYATGSGRSRRDFDAEVMEITLPRVLPHMVIDSLVEDGNGNFSTLPIEFAKDQKIDLEGDFYKYFSIYAPDQYGISALTIIAPDAMDSLIRNAALCDIEIIDNKLYFYWPAVAVFAGDYEKTFHTVEEVLKEISKKLSSGDIYKDTSQAKVQSNPNGQGVHLKRRNMKVVAVIGFGLIVATQLLQNVDGIISSLFGGSFIILVLAGLVLVARHESRRNKLRIELEERYTAYKKS